MEEIRKEYGLRSPQGSRSIRVCKHRAGMRRIRDTRGGGGGTLNYATNGRFSSQAGSIPALRKNKRRRTEQEASTRAWFVSVEISRGKNRGEDVTTGCKKLRHAREHLSLDFFHSRNPTDRDNLKRDRNVIFFFETSFLFFSLLYRREEFISLFLESRNPLKKL